LDEPVLFVARAHEAFTRIHPFTVGNGRVARLLANLMLRRLGLAPFIVGPSDVARYRKALFRADSGDIWPLATAIGRSVLASLTRLEAAAKPSELRALSSFARGAAREALYKAFQRDRLRAIRRGRALFTTRQWIDEYRNSTGAAGSD
jgi:Fic family protein